MVLNFDRTCRQGLPTVDPQIEQTIIAFTCIGSDLTRMCGDTLEEQLVSAHVGQKLSLQFTPEFTKVLARLCGDTKNTLQRKFLRSLLHATQIKPQEGDKQVSIEQLHSEWIWTRARALRKQLLSGCCNAERQRRTRERDSEHREAKSQFLYHNFPNKTRECVWSRRTERFS